MQYNIENNKKSQKSAQHFYIGSSNRITYDGNDRGTIIFSNPRDSGVYATLHKINFINLSDTPIAIDLYSSSHTMRKLSTLSPHIIRGNLNSNRTQAKSQIHIEINATPKQNKFISVLTVAPFQTLVDIPSVPTLLIPGTERTYIFQSLQPIRSTLISMTFEWSEIPIE